jgi:uncharacterized membrane protein YhiD involved in acid resistance
VLRDPHGHVRGLTTASAIWAIASVGVAVGAARFVLGTLVTLLFLVLLELRSIPVLKMLDPGRWADRFLDEHEPRHDPDHPDTFD